jgi:hypothetical protein
MNLWQIYVACNNETYLGLHVKCLMFMSYFKNISSFRTYLHGSPKYHIFTEMPPVGDALIRVDRRRDRTSDMTKLLGTFRRYTNSPKKANLLTNSM